MGNGLVIWQAEIKTRIAVQHANKSDRKQARTDMRNPEDKIQQQAVQKHKEIETRNTKYKGKVAKKKGNSKTKLELTRDRWN